MKTLALAAAVGSLAAISAPAHAAEIAPVTNASVVVLNSSAGLAKDPPRHARAYGKRAKDRQRRIYDDRGYYLEPRRVSRGDRVWRGRDGRFRCRRENGTTGLIIGAAGGALLGRTVDTRGDRTVGTLLGGALGAVLGREIDRGTARCR